MYMTITTQDTINQLAQQVVHRESEVHSYQVNIDNFNQILSTLPQGDVPAEFTQYVGVKPENHTKVEDLPLNLSGVCIGQFQDSDSIGEVSQVLNVNYSEFLKTYISKKSFERDYKKLFIRRRF